MVYVGIVSFNTLSDLPDCIACVKKQTYKDLRIIVLDNNSSDRSVAWLRTQKGVTLIESRKNLGFGRAHNAIISSIRLKQGDYYVALNPDVRMSPSYVLELVKACKTHKAHWATGKLYKDVRSRKLYSAGHGLRKDGYAINIGYGEKDSAYWNQGREIFGAPGAAPLYTFKLIKALSRSGSFFDQRMFLYYEDVDVDWRARLLGFRCWYEPAATAEHPGGGFRSAYEIEALANRYRSVFKNAILSDLLLYNIPRLTGHVLLRLLTTPRKGLRLLSAVMRRAAVFPFNRTRRTVSAQYMNNWFIWSARQPTRQPSTLTQRFVLFLRTNMRS